jgi:hypothetical protein
MKEVVHVIVVGFFIEVQIASIAEHYTEFGWACRTQKVRRGIAQHYAMATIHRGGI